MLSWTSSLGSVRSDVK